MQNKKILFPIIGAVVLLVALMVAGTTAAGPPEPRELRGLREAPTLPVNSIITRRNFPDHPLGGPPGQAASNHCDKDVDLTSTLAGVVAVAAQDNVICTSADIDTYVRGSSTYVVQGGGEEAAWTHTNVSNPASPVMVGQFVWSGSSGAATYTPDLKTFQQGANDYIVMGLERLQINGFCGVVIYDVTDPANPTLQSQFIGTNWCDTHNVFVEDDASGNGAYIYATADATNDLRVLDISGALGGSVTNPVEIGRYTSPTANTNNYVHDVTVIDHGGSKGRRVYLAYWDTGLVVLNAAGVTPGTNPTPIIGPNQLDPNGFLNHHSFPTQDGNFVFIQDEFIGATGQPSTPAPVQMWEISNEASPTFVDGLNLGSDVPTNPAHNLEIRYEINANRLYVGWYKLGLQAWDFTGGGFVRSNPAPRTAVQYHQAQTEGADAEYSGAWGVRMENIGSNLYIFQSDRNFGLIVDCVGCAPPAGMHVGDLDGSSAPANKGRWDATVTVTVHDDSEEPVANATVNGTWSAGASGSGSCTTDGSGECSITKTGNKNNTASVTFTVNNVTHAPLTYQAGDNHDPDGDSDGTSIVVDKPGDGDPPGGTGTVKGTVSVDTGSKGGFTVSVDTGQSDGTNNGGKYSIGDVPTGQRTVSADKLNYTCNGPFVVQVDAGATVTQDFSCTAD